MLLNRFKRLSLISVAIFFAHFVIESPALAQNVWNGLPKCSDQEEPKPVAPVETSGEEPSDPPATKPVDQGKGDCECLAKGEDLATKQKACIPSHPSRCEKNRLKVDNVGRCVLKFNEKTYLHHIPPDEIIDTTIALLPSREFIDVWDVQCNSECKPTAKSTKISIPTSCKACWDWDPWPNHVGKKIILVEPDKTATLTVPTDKLCTLVPANEGVDGAVLHKDCFLATGSGPGGDERCNVTCILYRLNSHDLDESGACKKSGILVRGDCTFCSKEKSPDEFEQQQ